MPKPPRRMARIAATVLSLRGAPTMAGTYTCCGGGAIWRTPHAGQISAITWIWLPHEVQNLVWGMLWVDTGRLLRCMGVWDRPGGRNECGGNIAQIVAVHKRGAAPLRPAVPFRRQSGRSRAVPDLTRSNEAA